MRRYSSAGDGGAGERTLGIDFLGPFQVSVGHTRSSVGPNRARTLLAVLAFTPGQVVSMDFLIDELLTGAPSKNPRNALQAGMHRLRTALEKVTGLPGSSLVCTSANGYLLDVPDHAVDAHRFDRLATRGSALVQRSPDEAITVLEESLQLWRGAALLDVSGGLRCQTQVTRLNNQRLSALEDLYEARLISGAGNVVGGLEQLAAEHPERERISELLMLALYRSGRRREALETFHRARSWLRVELGLEPGRKIRSLQEAILTEDSAIDAGRFPMEVR